MKNKLGHLILKHKWKIMFFLVLSIWYYFCLPQRLFDVPYSTVIESKEGILLDAHIAKDEQWRFPRVDSVPYKYKQSVLFYEDEHFYSHPGFNPISILNAMRQNFEAGKVVRGGSTITQQVIRLARKKERSYYEKLVELIWATRLELKLSKDEILELYASHAPYGGNVIGLEMASYRYFGRSPHELSWAESATLAVLPNAPGLIYPGKRQNQLKQKRDQLLFKLKEKGIIDQTDYELSIAERVPDKNFNIPRSAPHLLNRINKEYGTARVTTTIEHDMQQTVNRIVNNHYQKLKLNGVHNLSMLVLDIDNMEVVAYVGNSPTTSEHGKDVDIITAPRSTGSVLKPFLYASMMDQGELLPKTFVPDVPTLIDGFRTENFNRSYTGMIPADKALARSLNIPAVRLLQQHTVPRFYNKLQQLQLTDVNRGANTYGLSLVIGGAESSLWDMCKAYAVLAKQLKDYEAHNSEYHYGLFEQLTYIKNDNRDSAFAKAELTKNSQETNWYLEPEIYGAGSIYQTFEAMKTVNRPEGEEIWHFFNPDKEIAWKTGTSYGNRDAWAIGVTPKYVIGVWTGNADGEGRAAMTGIDSAAPVLFDLFNRLPQEPWFKPPYDDLAHINTCSVTGYLPNPDCPQTLSYIPSNGTRFAACPFHKKINIDKQSGKRATTDCREVSDLEQKTYLILPPIESYFYQKSTPAFTAVPDYLENCSLKLEPIMSIMTPQHNSIITNTINVNGELNPVIFQLAHKRNNNTVHWYKNNDYLGVTQGIHEMPITAQKGKHLITAVDESGYQIKIQLTFK
ncbi:penicillin-binding protein 1C [Nonlabens tegetincola]|uniref:penicillin-binding protein 1C n=1 Tax=Nonlabens tegetincola TaxID=323273 RepID=UPI0030C7BDA8